MTYVNLEDAVEALEVAERICRAAIANGDATTRDGWRKALDVALDCSEALRALPTVSDRWEDIATAKQDGEWIVACRAGQEDSVGPVRWWRGRWTMPDGETWKAGWLTHWKPLGPLPAPPSE